MKKASLALAIISAAYLSTSSAWSQENAGDFEVFADFEGTTYSPWTTEGNAFSAGPVAVPTGQKLEAYQGKGLANSYAGVGDGATGKLISPEFVIKQPMISFLLGGGKRPMGMPETLSLQLLVDGKVVRSETGKNSDSMEWVNWDVSDLKGKTGRLVLEDSSPGGWGHIEVDQIVFSSIKMPVFSLASPFSDHMVLQRDKPVNVWGTALPSQEVRVTFAGQTQRTKADQNRRWNLALDPLPASATPAQLVVESLGKSGERVEVNDVLVGDVWLASGQSNMRFEVKDCLNGAEIIANTNLPMIRFLPILRKGSLTPQDSFKPNVWLPATGPGVGNFSGVAFFFASRIQERLNIPIGIIESAFGGTAAEAWTSQEVLSSVPQLKQGMENDLAKLAAVDADPVKAADPKRFTLPFANAGGLFNAMIHPLIPYTIRGIIWYQGESNAFRADYYATLLPMMINDWRARFGQGDIPFYIVQLANYYDPAKEPPPTDKRSTDDWVARLREAQLQVARKVPQTGLAVAIDVGEKSIHPLNKQDVGDRLARVALARTYDFKDVQYESPIYDSMTREGTAIRIKFSACPEGLMVATKKGLEPTTPTPDAPLSQFAIAGADRKFVWADARIEGKDTVVVSSPSVPEPVAVRYGWGLNPEGANLYGKNGLPASPFRTDDWPLPEK